MKYCVFNTYSGYFVTANPIHFGNVQFAWSRDPSEARSFNSVREAEEYSRTLQDYDNMRIIEINGFHKVRSDPNDDGEKRPIKRPEANYKKGPRFQRSRVLRTIVNPNSLEPIDQRVIVRDYQANTAPPIIQRAPAPQATLPPAAPPRPARRGDDIPENERNFRLNRAGIPRQYRPGDMTEYGWYDAEVEREIEEYMTINEVGRNDAIIAVFNNM